MKYEMPTCEIVLLEQITCGDDDIITSSGETRDNNKLESPVVPII